MSKQLDKVASEKIASIQELNNTITNIQARRDELIERFKKDYELSHEAMLAVYNNLRWQ